MTALSGYLKNDAEAKTVVIADRFEIDPNGPLPDLDCGSARAFVTRDRRSPDRELFAVICPPGIPCRMRVAAKLRKSQPVGVINIVEFGPVLWPEFERASTAFIHERPLGGSLDRLFKGADRKRDMDDAIRSIARSLVVAVRNLAEARVVHRAIRPSNIFFVDAARLAPVLGPCTATPAGFDQPAQFEPVERAMASPAGRGEGSSFDDVYALGATLAAVLGGGGVADAEGDAQFIVQRLERGSFNAYTHDINLPVQLIEPLRGMLADIPEERWGAVELEQWVHGQRPTRPRRGGRRGPEIPFEFAGVAYTDLRRLAAAMSDNPSVAVQVVQSGALAKWLQRSAFRADLAKTLVALPVANKGQKEQHEDLRVALAAITLDPAGPIRYRGYAVMPDGYGPALAVSWLVDGNPQPIADMVSHGLVSHWLDMQPKDQDDRSELGRPFFALAAKLRNTAIGFGLERCLYESNPDLPCQSRVLPRAYATDVRQVVAALEQAAPAIDPQSKPVDRHIAAFIAARTRLDLSNQLAALADPDLTASRTAAIQLLAILQHQVFKAPLPNLARWLADVAAPVVNSFRNRYTRQEIQRVLPQVCRQGDLVRLLDLVGNPDRRKRDADGFANAVATYATLQREIISSKAGAGQEAEKAREAGRQTASLLGILLALASFCLTIAIGFV